MNFVLCYVACWTVVTLCLQERYTERIKTLKELGVVFTDEIVCKSVKRGLQIQSGFEQHMV